ncbi:MAG: hypothetical protein IJV88_06585 [Ruminococcus sp.]|nr:hypothetical protein [Ruminococcus sp.]
MSFFNKVVDDMVNEKVPRKKRKRLIILIALLTLLSMTTSTVAWFRINTFSGVDTLDLHISVSAQLKVSMEDFGTDLEKYGKVITNEMIDGYLTKYDTNLEEIILDPVTTSDGVRFVNQRGSAREPNNRSYLEFDCFFIATEDMWVHLTTESTEAGNDDGTKVWTESTGIQADVVNCTRVGFQSENDTQSAIYEPNRGTPVSGQSTFDLPSGTMVYSNSTRLFHLNAMEPTMVTIRLWIDGEDPQCDDDVQDSHLGVQLSFIGCDDNNVPIS